MWSPAKKLVQKHCFYKKEVLKIPLLSCRDQQYRDSISRILKDHLKNNIILVNLLWKIPEAAIYIFWGLWTKFSPEIS